MTLEEFKELSVAEMCESMNKYMENHTVRNFKSGEMDFTYTQAEKALTENGGYKMNGVFWTEEQMFAFINEKKKERNKKELSAENVEQLLELLEPKNFERLLQLCDKYDYVSNFILRENRGIKIKVGYGQVRSTSVRVYDDTMELWKKFVAENKAYSALDLMNTALIEFMERYGYDTSSR